MTTRGAAVVVFPEHGHDLRGEPWEIRRATLTGVLRKAGPGLRLSEHLNGDGETIFRHERDQTAGPFKLNRDYLNSRPVLAKRSSR